MSGNAYWVKPAGPTRIPRHLATVVVETRPAGDTTPGGRTPLGFARAALTISRFREGRWGNIVHSTVDKPDEVHRLLEGWAPARGSLWVVSPVASAALTLTGWFASLPGRGARWSGRTDPRRPAGQSSPVSPAFGRPPAGPTEAGPGGEGTTADPLSISALVTAGKPDIVRYQTAGKSLTWVSGTQYFTSTEDSLADMVGFRWPRSGGVLPAGAVAARSCEDRAELWSLIFQQMTEWWLDVDGGPWAATPGGLAMSFVRKRLAKKSVLRHNDTSAQELEEAALFGGDARTWYYGRVGRVTGDDERDRRPAPAVPLGLEAGNIEHWDVSSMYPTILSRELFPERIAHTWDRPSPKRLAELSAEYPTVAAVRLRTDAPEYPHRHADRVVHPVGEYDAYLCGPELAVAVGKGHVVGAYRAVSYRPGRPFAGAAEDLIDQRQKAARAKDYAREAFVKLLANSFGGKLAQRGCVWARRPDVQPETEWGEWIATDPRTGRPARYRSRGGLVDVRDDPPTPGRPLAACFCFLTSHGRYLMRLLRESLPPNTVLSQDTDGIWVTGGALERFAQAQTLLSDRGYRLRRTTVVSRAVWYGPRHYWTDEGWTLAGMHDPLRWSDGLTFRDSYQTNPIRTMDGKAPVWVYDNRRIVRLGAIPADGTVGADGWLVPYRLAPGVAPTAGADSDAPS